MSFSTGVSPAFLRRVEIGKIAGETPALRKAHALCRADSL
jgi:hypothetical protein